MTDTRFKPGELWTGNRHGRPKGSKSLKTYVMEMFRDMTDEEKLKYLEDLPKDIIWRMAEGNPETKTDITSAGEALPVLVKFIDGKSTDNRDTG